MVRVLLWVLVAALVVGTTVAVAGALRWRTGTRELRAGLAAARLPAGPAVVDFRELDGLPAPVARYFRTVLTDGQPVISTVRVRHRGSFNMGNGADRWRPFVSDQLVVLRRPGFDWDARIALAPGIPVHVHDAYVAGTGILHAAVLGLFPVMDLRDAGALADDELMRFLAEAAWYPTALLPGQGVSWDPVDDRSARATLEDGPVRVTMLFGFGADDLIETVRADARGRMVGSMKVPTPWQGRFWNYAERDGMRVPLDGEVGWLLPEGPRPYWQGYIERIVYERGPTTSARS